MPGGKEHYVSHKFVRDAEGKYKHESQTFPATKKDAVLRLERRGSQLHYLVSEDNGQSFRTLKERPFSEEPIKVAQVYCQPGGQPNDVSLAIHDFKVEGEAFVRQGQKVAPRTRRAWWWWMPIAAGGIVVLGGLFWWRRRRA